MIATIHPSGLKGQVAASPSKSSMQRALAAALLSRKNTVIYNPGRSMDDKAALRIITGLGCYVEDRDDSLMINPVVGGRYSELDCGESGLSIRMFTPIAALSEHPVTITGQGSLLNRPMDVFDEVLPQLGVIIKTNNGKLPLEIQGPLKPRDIVVDGSLSSQFLTGLLMAYSGAGAKDVTIRVRDLKSKPYIDLTLEVIRQFRLADIENRDHKEYYFKGPLPQLQEYSYTVEGDWSGAAFLLVAGAIAGPFMITGLDLLSSQADRAIVDALMNANAGIAIEAKGIKLNPAEMNAFHFDATDCPDLFPPLVVLASCCKGKSVIRGASRLLHKESNRASTLAEEFTKLGITVELEADEMHITGGVIKGGRVSSHHDHRIAMALAVAGLKADQPTIIDHAEAVSKSYPGFFNDLEKLGADVSLDNKIKLHE